MDSTPAPTIRGTDQPRRRPIPINEPSAPAATAEAAGRTPPPRKATANAVTTAIEQVCARRR